jgi:hypothetical protein
MDIDQILKAVNKEMKKIEERVFGEDEPKYEEGEAKFLQGQIEAFGMVREMLWRAE